MVIILNSLILDLSVILVFCLFLISGFKNGLIKSFFGFISFVVSSCAAVYLADYASLTVYQGFIAPAISRETENLIAKNSFDASAVFSGLPNFVLNMLPNYGITPSNLNHIINNNAMGVLPSKIADVFLPMIIGILKPIFTALLFTILLFLTRFLIAFIIKLFKVPVLRQANNLIGGIFGFLKAYIVVAVFMFCLKGFLPFWENSPNIFSTESVHKTVVFKKIYENNLINKFFPNI